MVVCQDKLLITNLEDLVVAQAFIFLFLHDQVEVRVVDEDGGLFLHDDEVVKGIYKGDCDLELMHFFQPVLMAAVDLIDGEFISSQGINLIVLTQLNLSDFSRNVILSNLLGVEVKEGNL